ncbi:MAG: YqiA/YcfP family alpha/beta fold hydrolase [Candidatus Sulfopaludibacter sp.]|nr:YqiA/YcfP family alpha/beta fold hydrolase [Candidatus Sulfopaludibacter sp.]
MSPIIYLHGFASGPSSSKARFFRDRLERAGAQVEIPDLAAGDFEHLAITGQLGVLERAAAGRPVALMGSSMGGYLATLYAARHPEVTRLVLLAPAFGFARRWPTSLGPNAVDEWRARGTMDFFHYADNRKRALSYGLLEDAGKYEDFPEFRQPALIFHGALDDVVPVAYSQQFAAAHSNVTLEVLDSGHELLNVLEHMAERVVPFLTSGG